MLHSFRLHSTLLSRNCIHFAKYRRIPPTRGCLLPTSPFSSSKTSQCSEPSDSAHTSHSVCDVSVHSAIEHPDHTGIAWEDPGFVQKDGCAPSRRSQGQEDEHCLINAEISGLGSPISAMCWHKGPYSDYFGEESERWSQGERSGAQPHEDKALFPKPELVDEMEHLLSVERRERDRVRRLLEQNRPLKIDQHIRDKQLASRASTLKLLSISSKIAKRPASSAKPQLDMAKYLRERRYQRLLARDEGPDRGQKRRARSEPTIETVRILDVDRLPLPILHHMVCYTLVKNVPAEKVLALISNIASLRDKNKHACYQNLFTRAIEHSSPLCAAELVAALTRSYQSISIPFMVDYVRKYGTFSRRFLANMISKYSSPQPLDIFRYESHSRSLPLILTRPWSLMGFVNLLKNCSAKRYMYLNLLNYGYVPNTQKFDSVHAFGTMDYALGGEILSFERLLHDAPAPGATEDPNRPSVYDKILELQYSGGGNLEDLELATEGSERHEPTPTSLQFVKVLGDQGQADVQGGPGTHGERGPGSRFDQDEYRHGYKDEDQSVPRDGSHVSWSLPWGLKRDAFHYRGNLGSTPPSGKSYRLDPARGWIGVKSAVRTHYLRNVRMNKRKRDRRLLRRRADRQARLRVLSSL